MLIGPGATVSSLIRNSSDSGKLSIFFLCNFLEDNDKDNIQKLLNEENFKGHSFFIDFDPLVSFGELRSLHGDWTAYGRLLIAELITTDTVLYLDADLIVEIDVLEYQEFDFKGSALAAVCGITLRHALDNPFLHGRLGIPLDSRYFNSGVLLMNLKLWRINNYKEQCLAIARKYPGELTSHDQTLLNAVFNDTVIELPKAMNSAWYALKNRPTTADKMILHYLGSPKPWDIGGSFLHKGYHTWFSYLNKSWDKLYGKTTQDSIVRAWKIRRSYFRLIKAKIKS